MNRLGILAGGGGLPVAIAQVAVAQGRGVHIVGIKGEADRGIERYDHTWISWGQIGRMLAAFRQTGCRDLVIIGGVRRPDLMAIRFDWGAVRNFPLIASLTMGGDDTILTRIVRFFEANGLTVRGAQEVAPGLLAQVGPLGRHCPAPEALDDIAKGFAIVRALGSFDVGQAVVVAGGHVLAVEAAEGTDAMLQRAATLRQWGIERRGRRRGVLVKRPKPGQEQRIDLPAIGPRTVQLAADAGLAGIGVQARQVLMVDCAEMLALADAQGLFVIGVSDDG